MQPHNVPQFVQLLRERQFPIDGMRMEVIDTVAGKCNGHKGIITMMGEEQFSMEWCRWDCFLRLLAHFEFAHLLKVFLPYCLGLREHGPYEVDSERGLELQVIRAVK